MHKFDCPCNLSNFVHNSNSKWIEIKEGPKYKHFDNIGDLSKTSF